MSSKTFIFCSNRALYPPYLRVAEIISRKYELDGHIVAPEKYTDSPVWESSGRFEKTAFKRSSTSLKVHFLPARNGDVGRFGFNWKSLKTLLRRLKPDYIWIHAEFWEGITRQFLWFYRFDKVPNIVAYVAVNHVQERTPLFSKKWPLLSRTRLLQKVLWPRLNGVAACATKSMECARRIGLPESVPVVVNYLPVFGPQDAASEGITLPWLGDNSFTIGFAGLLSEQKGWKVLLKAVEKLPDRFKVVFAGDGEHRDELIVWLQKPSLKGRSYYAGLLPKDRLLAAYEFFDTLVLPSITTPGSVEQFGAVLAEAMACGVPVIGSDSGAIPETVGQAGLVVPEGDPDSLVKAIIKISEDEQLRKRSIAGGLERYRTHYSCEAYAKSIATLLGLDLLSDQFGR